MRRLNAGIDSIRRSNIVLTVRNQRTNTLITTECFHSSSVSSNGIVIGTSNLADLACVDDPHVSLSHGTLECTPHHHIWVYIDHSEHGTMVNRTRNVHNDVVIVKANDILTIGQHTEITVAFDNSCSETFPSPIETSIAPPPLSSFPLDQSPPEFINSPIPGNNWRKKRHSMTSMTSSRKTMEMKESLSIETNLNPIPSTPPREGGSSSLRPGNHAVIHSPQQSPYYHVKWKNTDEETPQSTQPAAPIHPPALEYSASPVTTPSLHPKVPALELSSSTTILQPEMVPLTHPTIIPPTKTLNPTLPQNKSRRDDLRIQVLSKKVSGYVPGSTGTNTPASTQVSVSQDQTHAKPTRPIDIPIESTRKLNKLGFTPPASPVAHQDLLRQNASLRSIVEQKKLQEQQLAQQQQQVWMAQNQSPTQTRAQPQSPIRIQTQLLEDVDDDDLASCSKAPALLRTVSLGINRPHQPSPRLTQAVLASRRGRKNSMEEQLARTPPPIRIRRSLSLSPSNRLHQNQIKPQNRSITSSTETEPTNYRPTHQSSSSIGSSHSDQVGDMSEFMGYEEEMEGFTSFTSHHLSDPPHSFFRSKEQGETSQERILESMRYSYASSSSSHSGEDSFRSHLHPSSPLNIRTATRNGVCTLPVRFPDSDSIDRPFVKHTSHPTAQPHFRRMPHLGIDIP